MASFARSLAALVASAAIQLSFGLAQAAPTLVFEGDKLAGEHGVEINGALYDVKFEDGSCISLFSGCDSSSDFFFQTSETASAASQALIDQVFKDELDPTGISGCGDSTLCAVITMLGLGEGDASVLVVAAYVIPGSQNDFTGSGLTDKTTNFSGYAKSTVAVWSQSSAVPEPGTLALVAAAGLGMLGLRRRT